MCLLYVTDNMLYVRPARTQALLNGTFHKRLFFFLSLGMSFIIWLMVCLESMSGYIKFWLCAAVINLLARSGSVYF